MALTKEKRISPPLRITALLQGQWANQILRTAVELDIFTLLKAGGMGADQVAAELEIDKRGCRLILNALTALEFLIKQKESYSLSEISEAYLVKDSPIYFGEYVLAKAALDVSWGRLTEAVKTGKPVESVNNPDSGEEFFRYLTSCIFPISYTTAQMLADELDFAAGQQTVRVLDLAAGSGVWSIPMAQANAKVMVDALDFPGILEVTREYAGKFGVPNQYGYLSGSWREVDLKPASYDYIVLGHILHCEGKEYSIELLSKCHAALKPGGKLVIAEFFSNEERTGPGFAQFFALTMFIQTDAGCVFSVDELKQMLQGAGFKNARRLSMPYWGDESPLMLADK